MQFYLYYLIHCVEYTPTTLWIYTVNFICDMMNKIKKTHYVIVIECQAIILRLGAILRAVALVNFGL